MPRDDLTIAPVRSPRSEKTRARICQAAREVFLTQGFDAATIEEIALSGGIPRSTLYTHFRDKNEILQAISDEYLAGLRRLIEQLPAPHPTRGQIDHWIAELAEFGVRQQAPTILLIHFSMAVNAPPAAKAFGAEVMRIYAGRLPAFANAIQPGQEIELVRCRAVLLELGWALCYHVENGGDRISQLMLQVAADLFERFLDGWF